MFNELFSIGPVNITVYGVMIMIGYICALNLSLRRGAKRNLDEDSIWGIFFCALIGGMIGTKILYYITILPQILADPSIILRSLASGHVVYGGIIGGVLTSYIYIHMKKQKFLPYFDLVMPAVAFAQGIGRIGCFFAGCCYGRETDAWYGIAFRHSHFAPNNVSLIPTQLISSAGDFLIFGLLMYYEKKEPKCGRVSAAYLVLYGVGRFFVEFLRSDYRGSVGILSTSQFISIAIVAAGIILYLAVGKYEKIKAL